MAAKAKKTYKFETGLLALSRVKRVLTELTPFALSELPNNNIDDFVVYLLFELAGDPDNLNKFMQEITKSKDDFTEMDFIDIQEACLGFFKTIEVNVLTYVRILKDGLKSQNTSGIANLLSTQEGKDLLKEMVNSHMKNESLE